MLTMVIGGVLACTQGGIDLADPRWRDGWTSHVALGCASYDAFVRRDGNPVHRGGEPYLWPVNGCLFHDPVSGNWYLYIGEYLEGYALSPEVRTRCVIMRSDNGGTSWERAGVLFDGLEHTFDGETSPQWHAPDVSVIHADGRYHMAYDWVTRSTTWENIRNPGPDANSGVGYAWAERPEGPWHPVDRPVATTRALSADLGKYDRIYLSSIVRRDEDWLILSAVDSHLHYGWGVVAMTAEQPEGPWSPPRLLLHPEQPGHHPPLLEFCPVIVHEGFIYAPLTSVALNRNYQALLRAPVEEATRPEAWAFVAAGGSWHAEPVEHEAHGIWGQAYTGFVHEGMLEVMFPSRDADGRGTINLARRPWDRLHDRGFVVSGHRGASLTLLKRAVSPEAVTVEGELHGTATVVWGADMPLGPDAPRADATLHPLTRTRYTGLRIHQAGMSVVSVDQGGVEDVIAVTDRGWAGRLELAWRDGRLTVGDADGRVLAVDVPRPAGGFGLLVAPWSHLRVTRLEVEGPWESGRRQWLYTEGLVGAAQNLADWEVRDSGAFRYGVGAVSREAGAAKWNVEGSRFRLWAPRGPAFGRATVWIDATPVGEVDFSADGPRESAVVLEGALPARPCSVRLIGQGGPMPVDVLEVVDHRPMAEQAGPTRRRARETKPGSGRSSVHPPVRD